MNKRQKERLLRVAKALREYQHPKRFTMKCYLHGDPYSERFGIKSNPDWCGTPGCAFGTFASRPDLQRILSVEIEPFDYPEVVFRGTKYSAVFNDPELLEYFGISYGEAKELFDVYGCNDAKTPIQAAKYIEKFVKNKYDQVSL